MTIARTGGSIISERTEDENMFKDFLRFIERNPDLSLAVFMMLLAAVMVVFFVNHFHH